MGIDNINILIEQNQTHTIQVDVPTLVQAAQEQTLVNAHRRGEHPYGSMRRACPLCQLGK